MARNQLRAAVAVLAAVGALAAGPATAGPVHTNEPPVKSPDKGEAKDKPETKDATKERDTLRGTWRVAKLDIEPGEVRKGFEKMGQVVFKGEKATLVWDLTGQKADKEALTWGEFTVTKIDPRQSPGAIDLRLDEGILIDDIKAKKGTVLVGIYDLAGDTLKLYFGEDGRPKGFPDKEKQGVVTLKRVKAPKDPGGKKDDKPGELPVRP